MITTWKAKWSIKLFNKHEPRYKAGFFMPFGGGSNKACLPVFRKHWNSKLNVGYLIHER